MSTIKKIKVTEHTDGGHGWLAVKRSLLVEVDALRFISACSYQKGGTVYLEEDCDAGIFYKLFFASKGLDYTSNVQAQEYFDISRSYKDRSPVRSFAPFNPHTILAKDVLVGNYIKVDSTHYFVEKPFDGKQIIIKTSMGQRFRLAGQNLDRIQLATLGGN